MRRREFISLLGGAAAAWPLTVRAQRTTKLPIVGFLGTGTPSSWTQWTPPFVQRLRELGWIEGRTVTIEYRWAEGRDGRYAEIAAEFVRLKVDIIVTAGAAVLAAKQATSVIPIVFAVATDPVGAGLVESLARPGGNVTGLSVQQPDLAGKRLEFLREVFPGLRRLAILANVANAGAVLEMGEVQTLARGLGFDVAILEKSGKPRISRLSLRHSRAIRMHFMSVPTRSYRPTGFASTLWRWARDCRRCMASGSTSKRAV